ncbi:hypothetical protein [Halorubrum sp. 2020YC2]|uniref:hypothetical protein n=1 Tax=Halorubrum sp. 2020YC2 TaxID=2836432 RepID=UPI002AA2AE07|nr:hypothetical protein [Halorubrum sp. 2020YC2]
MNATGLTGLPAAANASLDRGADLGRLDGLSFGVTRTTADGANGSDGGGALGSVPNESAVHLDRDGLFLVADGETAFGTESPPADGETFEAAFRVDDDRLRRRGEDANRVTTRLTHVAPDPTGERTQTGGGGESAATPSAGPEPTGTSAPSGTGTTAGSGGSGGAGASAGSGGSGGTTGSGGSAATDVAPGAGRSPGSGDSAAGGDPPGGGGGGAAGGSRGSGDDPGTTRPGAGGAADPGASEVPPPAGPPRPFATERTGGGADGTSTPGSRPSDGRPNGDRASGTDGEPATGPAGSGDASETGDSVSDEAAARDLGYDDAPIRSTAYDLPGFGPVGSLAAVACVLLLVRRRT